MNGEKLFLIFGIILIFLLIICASNANTNNSTCIKSKNNNE